MCVQCIQTILSANVNRLEITSKTNSSHCQCLFGESRVNNLPQIHRESSVQPCLVLEKPPEKKLKKNPKLIPFSIRTPFPSSYFGRARAFAGPVSFFPLVAPVENALSPSALAAPLPGGMSGIDSTGGWYSLAHPSMQASSNIKKNLSLCITIRSIIKCCSFAIQEPE